VNWLLQRVISALRKLCVKKHNATGKTTAQRTNVPVALSATTKHHRLMTFLHSKNFWRPLILSAVLLSAFFAWEINMLPRPKPTQFELIYTVVLVALLSFDAGLVFYRIKLGTCPLGAKRASTIAGSLGVFTLLCPACLLIPISLFGISLSLTFMAPFLPLLRVIVMFLLIVSTIMLWPKDASPK
tara:strand:- start:7756 stop:8310 length:555 start_codon:yes stop_codon:yes gene_type:complete